MIMKLKLAFFGTPPFAASFLEKLLTDKDLSIEVKLVVTQPDQPVGRKQILTPSPVKLVAQKHTIDVIESLEFNSKFTTLNSKLQDIDLAIIYYYGRIISKDILELPQYGFWNIHFSRLPQYRGTSPATFSLIMGDDETAVSLVLTDAKLDHGDLIVQKKTSIERDESRIELESRLNEISYELVKEKLLSLNSNWKTNLQHQDHSKATYTLFPTKNHGFITLSILKKAMNNEPLTTEEIPSLIKDYLEKNNIRNLKLEIRNSAKIVYDYFRGLSPWPGIWTNVEIKDKITRLKITDVSLNSQFSSADRQTNFQINKVQLEGKNEVDFLIFNKAYAIF